MDAIKQINGVLQGDLISPLLFNLATANVTSVLEGMLNTLLIMYADDMVLGSTDKEQLQAAIQKLERWAGENSFHINKEKTFQITFRRGGKISKQDNLILCNEPLEIVSRFKYLGVTSQTTAKSFSYHIQERSAVATKSIFSIKNLTHLSLPIAMMLFNTVISPIATYGTRASVGETDGL